MAIILMHRHYCLLSFDDLDCFAVYRPAFHEFCHDIRIVDNNCPVSVRCYPVVLVPLPPACFISPLRTQMIDTTFIASNINKRKSPAFTINPNPSRALVRCWLWCYGVASAYAQLTTAHVWECSAGTSSWKRFCASCTTSS